jgi:hypothetical protein
MKKIDIGQALANPDVAKALSEFTVDMMSNSDVTKKLREAFVLNKELQISSKKLIEAIESYNKKLLKKKVGFASSTAPHIYDLWSSSSNERLYKKNDNVFYVDVITDNVVNATIIHIDNGTVPPSYTIKINDAIDNAERNVEEYTLRVYDDNALDETKNVWLAEVNLRKVDNQLIDLRNEISELKADSNSIRESNANYKENDDYKNSLKRLYDINKLLYRLLDKRGDAMSKVRVALAQEDKATGEVPLRRDEMDKRIIILNKWDMDPLKEVWAKAKEAYDDARKKVRDVDDELAIENSKLAVPFNDSDNDDIKTQISVLNNQKTINEKAMIKAHDAFIAATNAIPYYKDIEKEIKKHKPPRPYRTRTEGYKNWTFKGGRNRRTKKAHYYSKRRRTRHYRSKRVRSK